MQRNLGDVRQPPRASGVFTEDGATARTSPAKAAGEQPAVQGNILQAWERARTELGALGSSDVISERAGAEPVPGGVKVRFLADTYVVDFRGRDVRHLDGPSAAPDVVLKILLSHYLLCADGRPLVGEHASFREFPGGQVYYGPFVARTVRPLVACFGADPQRLVRAGLALGGRPVRLGDAAIAVPVLPRLPVTAAVWRGDAEVAPSGSLLFDRSATGYLPLEDLVIAAQLMVAALRKAAVAGKEGSGCS